MSAKKTLTDRGLMTVWPKTVAKLQAICAESHETIAWNDMANDILDVYLTKYRSKKPLQLPDERFMDRNAEREWASVCL